MSRVLEFGLKPYLWLSVNVQAPLFLISSMMNRDRTSASELVASNPDTSSNMGLFGELPLELRILIWKATLTTNAIVTDVHNLVTPEKSIHVWPTQKVENINTAVLRTCRAIYDEALPILYRHNWLQFRSVAQIENFRSCRLPKPNPTMSTPHRIFGFEPELYGRLTYIRQIHLKLDSDRGYPMHHPRPMPWSPWAEYFEPQEKEQESLAFPALEALFLDFQQWNLGPDDLIRVEPFLRKLRPKGGLKLLTLYGILNESNLRDFKLGFVKHGGRFEIRSDAGNVGVTSVVTHDDVHSASKGVRAFLQERGG